MMDLKQCSKCDIQKPLSQFYRRKSGIRSGNYYEICKECFKLRGRNYYQDTREHQLQLVKIRVGKYKESRRITLAKIKNAPCVDCKELYPPWVLDFDHRDSSLKSGDIGHMFI